jgi:hypothetical protein
MSGEPDYGADAAASQLESQSEPTTIDTFLSSFSSKEPPVDMKKEFEAVETEVKNVDTRVDVVGSEVKHLNDRVQSVETKVDDLVRSKPTIVPPVADDSSSGGWTSDEDSVPTPPPTPPPTSSDALAKFL